MLLVVALPPAESGSVDLHWAGPESAKMPASTMLAQIDLGRIVGQRAGRGGSNNSSIPNDRRSGARGQGNHGPRITTPTHPKHTYSTRPKHTYSTRPKHTYPTHPKHTYPTHPKHTYPQHYPGSNFTPRPDYPPIHITNPVPSNVVPTQPEASAEPNTNIIPTKPEPNNFLDSLGIKRITPQQLKVFQDQITKKNKQLAEDLKKLFPGNDQAIDQLVTSANSGRLDAQSVQRFISVLGGNLSLQRQLQATGFFRRLIFNNLALRALLNVNLNLLNANIVNINIVNVNVGGGGVFGGFWGFPRWPWNYPIRLGPSVWWGSCGFCTNPYYNPNLNGAAVLGIPYSIVDPVSNYHGKIVTSGILLMNTGDSVVNFTLNGRRFALEPHYQQVVARSKITIAFDRGGSFGHAKYGIYDGWYKFTATDRGWELYKHTVKITLDNNDNPFPFGYVLNNQRQTLQPGYRQQHTGKYPLELKFDNGKGQTIRKMLTKGSFKVAVGANGGLELFRPEDVTIPPPIAEMSKKAQESIPNIFAEPEKIPSLFGDTASSVTSTESSEPVTPPTPSLFGPDS